MNPFAKLGLSTYIATALHKYHVARYMFRIALRLMWRAVVHDLSKFRPSEAAHFARLQPKLKSTTYGSPEYAALLAELKPALDLHYARNSHHPEFHGGTVMPMPFLDRVEMVCDWAAAGKRHANGSFANSIDKNRTRFSLSPAEEEELLRIAQALGIRVY